MDFAAYRILYHLGRRRLNSYADYLAFQRYQASLLVGYLEAHGVTLRDKRVLDLGSGLGGYAIEWRARGAQAIALDLSALPALREAGLLALNGDGQRTPFKSDTFDVVFCASLIEHVPHPERMLSEVKRVLKPGGICYLSFPPFYSPRGGHEFAPFHYFGEGLALKLARRDRKIPDWVRDYYDIQEAAPSFAETYKGWGLYRMTVARGRGLVKGAGFNLKHISTRYLPVNFAAIPFLGEVLTWHVQMILEKPS